MLPVTSRCGTELFCDRRDAGRRLASELSDRDFATEPVILGVPRGGVPVAFEIAKKLKAPLDVCIVRELCAPAHDDLAMGLIASGGVLILNQGVIDALDIHEEAVARVARKQAKELARRENAYRGNCPSVPVADRTVILVDDGLATGSTVRTAVAAIRRQSPRAIVLAVPVATAEICADLRGVADDVVCLEMPAAFGSVAVAYENFSQVSDLEVRRLLAEAHMQAVSHRAS